MITVVASIKVKAGHRDAYLEVVRGNIPHVRKEKGCIEYYVNIDFDTGISAQVLDENVLTVIEKWESLEALQAHLRAPHMLAYREKVKNILEGMSLTVLQEA